MNRQQYYRKYDKYSKDRQDRKVRALIILCLALVVSLATNLMMSMPAIAVTGELVCDQEEHEHTDECYTLKPASINCEYAGKHHLHEDSCYQEEWILTCDLEESEEHIHSDECYTLNRSLICNKDEYAVIHHHDDNCYDKDGNLICTLDETAEHIHTDSCYDAEGNIICGRREITEHKHDDNCYETDENGNRVLTCDKPEAVSHQHTSECFDSVEKILTCGKEEHTHTDNCYAKPKEEAASAEAETAESSEVNEQVPEEPEQVLAEEPEIHEEATVLFENHDTSVSVTVIADKDAFPEGTVMSVKEVEDAEVLSTVEETVEDKQIVAVKAVDITFTCDGEEVQPSRPITVTMSSDPVYTAKESSVVHIDEEGAGSLVAEGTNAEQLTFDTDHFSVYVLTYTVDFEYEVNGETYYCSMKGGQSVPLSGLLVKLGVTDENEVSEFISNIENVEFTDPDLLNITHQTPVLGLIGKEDWILESLKPFDTEETLTITMKDGQIFTVHVTDGQGVWDLADPANTNSLHVSTSSSVTQNEQDRDAKFQLHFTYSIKEDVVRAIDAYNGNFQLVYDLSSVINEAPLEINPSTSGVISVGTRRLGTYSVVNGKVILNFTDPSYFDGKTSFTGYFDLTAETNETELGDQDEYTYRFPGTTDVIPIHYKKQVEEGKKSVYSTQNSDGSYTLHYTANININTDLDSLRFNDTLSGLQTLDAASVRINGTAVSIEQSGQNFSFDVAAALGTEGVAKGTYQVTYETTVTEAQLKAMTADKTTETNKADWTVNGDKTVPGGKTSIEIDKPREPIPVTKTISSENNQPGDTVIYTVTYGNDKTQLSGFHISDYMTDVVIPQGDTVTLNYGNGQSVQVPFNSWSKDNSYSKNMVQLFDYTFPDGTQGTGPVTVTYSVQLIDSETAKANGVYESTNVVNIAQEHRQNTSDTKTTTVTYEKEPHYEVHKTVSANPDRAKWDPETVLTYTLTVGDTDTNMAGVNIRDMMSDQQILQGDIMIQIGNGQQMKLSDYAPGAIKWTDDEQYSDNRVELFNFNMPSDAGNGPVVITYQTKIISQAQATASDLYGEHNITNTGYGGNQQDSTSRTGVFEPYPIKKEVSQNGSDVVTAEMGSTVHYKLNFGNVNKNLAGITIYDEMTDLQKLVGNITVTKADGTTFTMPVGSSQWADDGVVWTFFDDSKYNSASNVRVFNYRLPQDIGNGPIIVEYDTQIINEDEANESGIQDTQHVKNRFTVESHPAETDVTVEFPKQPKHDPQVRKEFDHWDVDNSKLFWNIIVEKTADSAYPIENVSVREFWDWSGIYYESQKQGVNYTKVEDGKNFDIANAVVTTDDGTVLTPGRDYFVDKKQVKFTFPVLHERVHINLAFNSPIKIIDGHKMQNTVRLNDEQPVSAEAKYENPEIDLIKNGSYDENTRILEWKVLLNPTKKEFTDSDPVRVLFEDQIPQGLTLLNSETKTAENPSLKVDFPDRGYSHTVNVSVDKATNKIGPVDIAAHNAWGNQEFGLNQHTITVTYYTKLSDEEWDRITSSASGSETFENHVSITAGDGDKFEATDKVTVTSKDYLTKSDDTRDVGGFVVDSDGNRSKNITYSIQINPKGHKINSGNPLTLTDYIDTNMDLDTSSVQIHEVDSSDNPVAGQDPDVSISYNDDSRLLAIRNIPDQKHYILTYVCIARAQGQDTFTNTATLIGGGSHSSTVTEQHNIQSNDAGVKVEGIEMSLHKIDENQINRDLSNAEFQLYECKLKIGDMTLEEQYPQKYWDDLLEKMNRISAGNGTETEINDVKEQFKIIEYVPVGNPAVTGVNGTTQFTSLSEHKLYAWKEIKEPENYTGNTDYHYFVGYQHIDVNSAELPQSLLSEEEQLNRKHAAWALDDAAQFANGIKVASMSNLTMWTVTNVELEYTSISATKEWEGDSDNLFDTRPKDGIRLQLWKINADGTRETVGGPVAINADEHGNWPSYIWNRLPANDADGNKIRYTVVEERVDDYTTSYSDEGEGVTSGTITVTNKMIPKNTSIAVKKVFADELNQYPSQIMVDLMVIRTDREGNSSEPEIYATAALTESDDWKYVFSNLPTKEVIDGKPYYLTYTVNEQMSGLEQYKFTVTYSDNQEGVIEAPEDNPLIITNSVTKFSFSKIWQNAQNGDTTEWPAGQRITVTLHRKTDTKTDSWHAEYVIADTDLEADKVIHSQTQGMPDLKVTDPEHFSFEISNLDPADSRGNAYTYYISEARVSGFKQPVYTRDSKGSDEGAYNGGFIVNTPDEAYELPESGGPGIHLYTGAGILLLIGTLLLYINKKKHESEADTS